MRYLLVAFSLLVVNICTAQNKIYSVEDLSSYAYKTLADTAKKSWVCPKVYTDKSTQSDFCSQWNMRTNFLQESIKDNDYLNQKEMSQYLDEIATELYEKNKPFITSKPIILVDRSSATNAYSIGKNIVVINMGLISFCRYKEELALVIAHEIGHNYLDHTYQSMCKKAEWLNSKEYKDFIKDLTKDQYGRYTKIINTFKEYSYNRNKHNRYGEHAADSMAIKFLSNTKFGFDAAYFLRLDSSDLEYKTNLSKPLADYFNAYHVQLKPEWTKKKGSGLSTRAYNFEDKSSLSDTLKTHPDCIERNKVTKSKTTLNPPHTPIPASLKTIAAKSIIWNLYRYGSFTSALYRLNLLADSGIKDSWTDFMFTNVLISLYAEDVMLNRSNVIKVKPKEYIGKDYYALQTMLEQVTADDLNTIKNTALQYEIANLGDDEKKFRSVLKSLAANPEEYKYSKKDKKKEYQERLTKTIYFEYFN